MKIRILVVDDSALIRALLSEIINEEKDFELIGTAPNAFVARDLVNKHNPDVITLDVEMPKVDGLTFLDRLMKAKPTPVLMISTLTEKGADVTLQAMELGAIDYIAKPKVGIKDGIQAYQDAIVEKIRIAAQANVVRKQITNRPQKAVVNLSGTEKLIAIGASTGGTEAIKTYLLQLPANSPAVVITQHMPPGFTSSFAKRLDSICDIKVKEVKDGERLIPGHAYLAPGGYHFRIQRSGADYIAQLTDGERISGHKPSVDVMFSSLAEVAAINTVAILMTGMGKDGAKGLKQLHDNGAFTLAQDQDTCVVYGMPKEAVKLGAVSEVHGLEQLAPVSLAHLESIHAGSRV